MSSSEHASYLSDPPPSRVRALLAIPLAPVTGATRAALPGFHYAVAVQDQVLSSAQPDRLMAPHVPAGEENELPATTVGRGVSATGEDVLPPSLQTHRPDTEAHLEDNHSSYLEEPMIPPGRRPLTDRLVERQQTTPAKTLAEEVKLTRLPEKQETASLPPLQATLSGRAQEPHTSRDCLSGTADPPEAAPRRQDDRPTYPAQQIAPNPPPGVSLQPVIPPLPESPPHSERNVLSDRAPGLPRSVRQAASPTGESVSPFPSSSGSSENVPVWSGAEMAESAEPEPAREKMSPAQGSRLPVNVRPEQEYAADVERDEPKNIVQSESHVQPVAAELERLQKAVEELTAKTAARPPQIESQSPPTPSPTPPQPPVVIVNQVRPSTAKPRAYWERRFLRRGSLRGRI